MRAPASHARLSRPRAMRNLVTLLAVLSLPALGCVVSLDGLTGGNGSSDAAAPASSSSSSGGGDAPGSSDDAGKGGQTPPSSPDASTPSRGDASSTSTGGGPDDAAGATDTSTSSAPAGALVFGAPTATSSPIGGSTGSSFSQTCPAGGALVGFNFVSDTRSPFALFQVQPICAEITVTPEGALSFAIPAPLVLVGDDAGNVEPGTLACPSGMVVTGIKATAEKYVHSVFIQCQALVASPAGAGGVAISLGNASVQGPFGNTTGGYSTFTYVCPSTLVANALAGTAGGAGFLDSIVLGCATASSP